MRVIKIEKNNIDEELIKESGLYLREGKLVAFPTETVYGLGCNALDSEAFKKIFIAKGRPSDNPLIVHVGSVDDVYKYVSEFNDVARKLANKFWPGPMTLVLNSNGVIPKEVYGNLPKIGIRIPSHPVALALLKEAKVPVCAPSANTSGKPSPTSAKYVIEDLDGKIDLIIDGGDSEYGVESTVIDVGEDDIAILRPGGITLEMVREVFPLAKLAQNIDEKTTGVALSPGMKYRHYTPKAKVILVTGRDKNIKIKNYLLDNSIDNYRILGALENREKYVDFQYKDLGTFDDMKSFSHNLFRLFREADDDKIEYLFVEEIPNRGIGLAVMNRINRAKTMVL